MPNGIYIQTEYHGKLIRKIVCNGKNAGLSALTALSRS